MPASLGLGLAALGRPGYINLGHADDVTDRDPAAMERAAHAVLDAAYESGVRWFDAARSYGAAEAFLASWLGARGIEPGDVARQLEVGLRLHRRLARGRGGARGQGALGGPTAPPVGGDARAAGGASRPVPDPLGHARERRARRPRGARRARRRARRRRPRRGQRHRRGAGGHDRARAGHRRLRRGAGHLESARALRGAGARARPCRRPAGARQGGGGQRAPDAPGRPAGAHRRGRRARHDRGRARAGRRAGAPLGRHRAVGRGHRGAAPAATWPRASSCGTTSSSGASRALAEEPEAYWATRSELPWN